MSNEPRSIEALDVLIGRWEMVGRSFNSERDNVSATVTGSTLLNGTLLQLAGTISIGDFTLDTMELVWADKSTGEFSAHAYSPLSEPVPYTWARTGPNTLRHAGAGATYHGTISDDGKTITGAWEPDPGQPKHAGSAYTATMRRVD